MNPCTFTLQRLVNSLFVTLRVSKEGGNAEGQEVTKKRLATKYGQAIKKRLMKYRDK
jgi:hypothetical protein